MDNWLLTNDRIGIIVAYLLCSAFALNAQGQNLLVNGSFEDGTTGWTTGVPTPEVVTTIDNSVFFDGTASARIEITSSSGRVTSGWWQKLPVVAGKRYYFEYSIKVNVDDYAAYPLFVFETTTDSIVYEEGVFASANVVDWRTYEYRFIAPPQSSSIIVALVLAGDTATCWFDALQLTEVVDTSYQDYQIELSDSTGLIVPDISVNSGPSPSGSFNIVDLSPEFLRLGVKYVRTHDYGGIGDHNFVFPDTTADPLDPESYDFPRSDTAIAAIIDIGSEVFFRLGETGALPPVYNNPPSDYMKWAQVALHIVKHYNEGWNNGFFYNIRYWEIWNEPSAENFWSGSAEEYAHLYATTANLIKAHDPTLQIGGPVLADYYNRRFLNVFFDTLSATGAPLDFYSYHNYVTSNPMFMVKSESFVRGQLASYGYTSIPTFISEWSNCTVDDRYWNVSGCDNPLGAALAEASLIYMQQAGITGEIYYRTDFYPFGLYNYGGGSTFIGQAFEVFSDLRQTPNGVFTSGGDSLGTALIAGQNNDGTLITAIISDNSSNANGYRLHLNNLSQTLRKGAIHQQSNMVYVYHYDIMRIDSTHQLTLSDSGTVRSDNPVINVAARSPFVDKLTFQRIDSLSICCVDRGNADSLIGPGGPIDVSDLTYLVGFLFKDGTAPPCTEEGNVDGIVGPGGPIDVSDLTYLVAFLFKSGPAPPVC